MSMGYPYDLAKGTTDSVRASDSDIRRYAYTFDKRL